MQEGHSTQVSNNLCIPCNPWLKNLTKKRFHGDSRVSSGAYHSTIPKGLRIKA